ncbi:hypothetical protein ZWY2020_037179, partial [Hordeum vulgare]
MTPRPSRHPHLFLPVRSHPDLHIHTPTPPLRLLFRRAASFSNDLPASPGLPFLRITQESLAAAPLLLLIPVATLSLSRFPPVPLLAAVFAAGFATARHLSPAPGTGGSSTQCLAALLADLDARLLSLKDRLLAAADNGDGDRGHPILEPLDRLRAKPQSVLIALGSEGEGSEVPPHTDGSSQLASCASAAQAAAQTLPSSSSAAQAAAQRLPSSSVVASDTKTKALPAREPLSTHKSCRCDKSKCENKHCVCVKAGLPCCDRCECKDCDNSKTSEEKRQDLRIKREVPASVIMGVIRECCSHCLNSCLTKSNSSRLPLILLCLSYGY